MQAPESPNNAARVVGGSKKYDHITQVLKDLHWLPIRKRVEFKILLLTFKCMQGCVLLYLRKLLVKQADTRTLRSDTKIPHTNLLVRFGDRAYCANAPRLWNEIPDIIKAADNVQKHQETVENIAISRGVYLKIWTIIQICHASVGILMECLPEGGWFSRGRIPTLAWHICFIIPNKPQFGKISMKPTMNAGRSSENDGRLAGGHDGMANLCKPITAYDFHVRYNKKHLSTDYSLKHF